MFYFCHATCIFHRLSFKVFAQEPPDAATLKPGDKAEVLFIASAPGAEKDEKGQPVLASLDPVAFLVGSELRDCATAHPAPGEVNVPKATIQTLNRFYIKGRRFPLWWGGAPWGEAEAISSCIDGSDGDYLDFEGCFACTRTRPITMHKGTSKELSGQELQPLEATLRYARRRMQRSGRSSFKQPPTSTLPAMFGLSHSASTLASSGRCNSRPVTVH